MAMYLSRLCFIFTLWLSGGLIFISFWGFFNLTWDFFFHHHPHLQSLCAPWHPPLLDVSVMTLCISSQTSHKLQKVSHFWLFTLWHNFRNKKIQTVKNLPGYTVVAYTTNFLNTFIEFCHLENCWNYFELELKIIMSCGASSLKFYSKNKSCWQNACFVLLMFPYIGDIVFHVSAN